MINKGNDMNPPQTIFPSLLLLPWIADPAEEFLNQVPLLYLLFLAPHLRDQDDPSSSFVIQVFQFYPS